MDEITSILNQQYGISNGSVQDLRIPVNDVFRVVSAQGEFALKLYNVRSRNRQTVAWEMDLLQHVKAHHAPIVSPVEGRDGLIQQLIHEGIERVAVLFPWAPGRKPVPSRDTYRLLGEAAARIHTAADSFTSTLPREQYDLVMLIDTQLTRLRPALESVGEWTRMQHLADRLRARLDASPLDYGVCHMDLTLDNVHISDGEIFVFDFDSAAYGFRANEAHGVCKFSREYFQDWLEGYRSVRAFPESEERAVSVFAIVGEIRGIAWKLGLAESSRGEPLMHPDDLPAVIDNWLQWERDVLS